jgi:hypothetical protein
MTTQLAVITPIVLQTEAMLKIYLSNLETYRPPVKTKIFLICNRNVFS